MLIRDIIHAIEAAVPPAVTYPTNDKFRFGNPYQQIAGIAVTFMASRQVLEQAAEAGVNLVIAHEPAFYLEEEESPWLAQDPVYGSKRQFLEDSNIVLWQFHDGWHRKKPDGILEGLVRKLGWAMPADPYRPFLCEIETTTLGALAAYCRKALKIGGVRVVGDLQMPCSRIVLLPGAWGGKAQMEAYFRDGAEVVICGESPEWVTCEYVRDAGNAGIRRGLIVAGHANSEEAGMEYCAEWLRTLLPPAIPIHYLPSGDPFQIC